MNPTLAALYGTGIEKTASDENEEIDLTQISAADFLTVLNEIEEEDSSEKTAGDEELDLSSLTDEELVGLYNNLESEDTIEKMASSGELEYWDMAGRVMAHAYADELTKEASEEEVIDLNTFSADQLIELGRELEKEAMPNPLALLRRAPKKGAIEQAGAALRAKLPKSLQARVKGLSDKQLVAMASGGAGAAGLGLGAAGAAAMRGE
jgi:hypothetical protein